MEAQGNLVLEKPKNAPPPQKIDFKKKKKINK